MTTRPKQIPCVFREPLMAERIDPRIKAHWDEVRHEKAPFGDFRRTWKTEHCRRVSGTGQPEDCPYGVNDCARAFMVEAMRAADPEILHPGAYFRIRAKLTGMNRADEKPARRDSDQGPSDARAVGLGGGAGREGDLRGVGEHPVLRTVAAPQQDGVRNRLARPISIASMLRVPDGGPRQGRTDDGEAGSER